jgi:hypothetical protein
MTNSLNQIITVWGCQETVASSGFLYLLEIELRWLILLGNFIGFNIVAFWSV